MYEVRYSEMKLSDNGRVEGTLIRYGDSALVDVKGVRFHETFEKGAFGDVSRAHVQANLMHLSERPLGASPDDGLTLRDTGEEIRASLVLPKGLVGDNTRKMFKVGALTGFSVEFWPIRESVDEDARQRVIQEARLIGAAAVDVPAYTASQAMLKRFKDTEHRAAIDITYQYGHAETMTSGGKVRKQRIKPGAFTRSIEDPEQEILMQLGRDPGKSIASKLSGTLKIDDGPEGLSVSAKPPMTTAYADLRKQVDAGMEAHLVPLFRIQDVPDSHQDVPEPGRPGVYIREISNATLFALAVTMRAPKGSVSAVKLKRSIPWLL